MKKKRVYLDHAAATPADPSVVKAMAPFWKDDYGNASSFHAEGVRVKEAVATARATIASVLQSQPSEILFTGSGTESCNIAIRGIAKARARDGKRHIVTTAIEHYAVLSTCRSLAEDGSDLTEVAPDETGVVSVDAIEAALRDDTALVSVMYANNEIGAILPIRKIGQLCRERGIPFHVDACQASGLLRLDVDYLQCDLLTLNASKAYGPKGVGLLFVRTGTKLEPVMTGGGQERGLRPGTISTPLVVGFAAALEQAESLREQEVVRLSALRDGFIEGLLALPGCSLNGHSSERLANNVNVSFEGVSGESLVLYLDAKGIACSSGAACTSEKIEPSHVLSAIGKTEQEAMGSVRFSLGRSTTREEIDTVLSVLPDTLDLLRQTKKEH